MGELNIKLFGLARRGETELRPAHEAAARGLGANASATVLHELRTLLPAVDHAVLAGEYSKDVAANFAEGLRPGVDGWVDGLAFVRP